MLKLMSAALLAGAVVMSTLPAQAGGYHHRGWGHPGYHHGFKGHHYKHYRHYKRHGHYRHRHYRRGHDIGDEILLGAGIIGGAIVLNGILTAPPPAPRYYAPPPPPQPYCTQDQVYRYLPDGSVQWGTRTRCY